MSDYTVTKAYEKYTQNRPKPILTNRLPELECRCERCKTELPTLELNEFFMKLYCDYCLKAKIKYRVQAKLMAKINNNNKK